MLDDIEFKKELDWSDLELALGKFCKEAESKEEFEEFYFYLSGQLKKFLEEIDQQFSISEELKEKYANDLITPDYYLTNREKEVYRSFFNSFPSQRNISVLTFNYTSILETALRKIEDPKFGLRTLSHAYLFTEYLKIHGSLSSPMLMGVDNKEQIQNPLFAEDPDIADFFIKPVSNFQFGTLVDEKVKTAIGEANLIVTMGISFGDTDKTWWKYIGNRISSSSKVRVIIYHYCKDIDDNEFLKQRVIRSEKQRFLEQCSLTPKQIVDCSSQVNVAINQLFLKPDERVVGLERKGY